MSINVNEPRSLIPFQENVCRFCHAIELLFANDASKGEPDSKTYTFHYREHLYEDHSISEIRFNQRSIQFVTEDCSRHGPFLKFIVRSYLDYQVLAEERKHIRRTYDIVCIRLNHNHLEIPQIQVLDYKRRPRYTRELLLRDSLEGRIGQNLHETALNTDWIDLDMARKWLYQCTSGHKAKCQLFHTRPIHPAWLIDLEDNCLVPGDCAPEYVALSYRWGNVSVVKENGSSFKQRTTPGGLSDFSSLTVPVIQHSMHTSRAIGERYLWIDAICLDQENKEHMSEELQKMGEIYAGAKLTIIATDGDAMAGLPGLQGVSQPRDLNNIFPWTTGREVVVRQLPALSHYLADSPLYFQRGWTFQEYFLSRRKLIFGHKQIHWSCSCETWHEDLPDLEHEPDESILRRLQFTKLLSGKPDLEQLDVSFGEYNSRELSYPEDALPGVIGLTTMYSRSLGSGFLFGLPTSCFEAALMWCYNFGANPIGFTQVSGLQRRERRTEQSTRGHSLLPDSKLPSWSWIGWKGRHLTVMKCEDDFLLSNKMRWRWITLPLAQWYSHDAPESRTKTAIPSILSQWYENGNKAAPLPDGWTREEYDASKHLDKDHTLSIPWGISGRYVYHHKALPGMYFWRPFLAPVSATIAAASQVRQDEFISCDTRRGWFRAVRKPWSSDKELEEVILKQGASHDSGEATHTRNFPMFFGDDGQATHTFDFPMNFHLRLLNESGKVCGWLQLHGTSEAQHFSHSSGCSLLANRPGRFECGLDSCVPEISRKVEVVAICRRMWPRLWKTTVEDRTQYQEFYGVLYVEWIDGVAYRKGCGYVKKQMWESHDLEDIHLILG